MVVEHLAIASLAWYEYVFVVIVGGGVGFVGGFAGIGGLPLMVALVRSPPLDVCQHEAQGTVLAVMLPPMSLLGVLVMREEAKLLWKHAGVAFVCYACTSYLGALLAYMFDGKILGLLFATHMIALALYYTRRWDVSRRVASDPDASAGAAGAAAGTLASRVTNPLDDGEPEPESANEKPELETSVPVETPSEIDVGAAQEDPMEIVIREGAPIPFEYWSMAAVGACIGVVGGLFGIGAGVFMVPIMTELMGMSKNDARTLSLLILLPPASFGAVIEYARHDNIDWWLSAMLFVLYFFTNPLGARVGKDINSVNFMLVCLIHALCLGASDVCFDAWIHAGPSCCLSGARLGGSLPFFH
jgi:uncharacterized membrane protein YfcA